MPPPHPPSSPPIDEVSVSILLDICNLVNYGIKSVSMPRPLVMPAAATTATSTATAAMESRPLHGTATATSNGQYLSYGQYYMKSNLFGSNQHYFNSNYLFKTVVGKVAHRHSIPNSSPLCPSFYKLSMLYTNISEISIYIPSNHLSPRIRYYLPNPSLALIALRIYYHTLIYLHDLLSAGPLIIILTLFTLLYTIGLGDNTGAGSGIPSAYSVFNRGVRRILGTVDGEELARQFAGGMAAVRVAAAGGGGGRGRGGMNNRDDDEIGGVWMMHHDENERNHHRRVVQEEEEPINVVNERRRQRRLERLQQQQRMGGEEGTAFLQRQEVNDVDGEDDIDDGDENFNHGGGGGGDAAPARTGAGVARKSGKKARRKNNVEMRREIQRQRQAAAAMGFGHGMENDDGGGAAALLLEEMDFDDMRDFDE